MNIWICLNFPGTSGFVELKNLVRPYPFMPHIIEVKELAKVVNERILVDRISFIVNEGEIFGLLGSNGSGKTTTFNMLTGLLRPSSGTIRIGGREIKNAGSATDQIGFVVQDDSIYETLTVRENLEYFSELLGVEDRTAHKRIDELIRMMKLDEKSASMAGKLSGGLRKRVNIACALLHDPKIIFMDEPTVGLDPIVRREIWAIIRTLHEKKKTIIITSHYMDEIEQLCDRVAIMFRGRIVDTGTPTHLKEKYGLKQMEDVFAHLITRETQL